MKMKTEQPHLTLQNKVTISDNISRQSLMVERIEEEEEEEEEEASFSEGWNFPSIKRGSFKWWENKADNYIADIYMSAWSKIQVRKIIIVSHTECSWNHAYIKKKKKKKWFWL